MAKEASVHYRANATASGAFRSVLSGQLDASK